MEEHGKLKVSWILVVGAGTAQIKNGWNGDEWRMHIKTRQTCEEDVDRPFEAHSNKCIKTSFNVNAIKLAQSKAYSSRLVRPSAEYMTVYYFPIGKSSAALAHPLIR